MNRKDEHLSLAKAFHKEKSNDFDRVRFVHQSFAESAVNEVDISTSFLSFQLPQPPSPQPSLFPVFLLSVPADP